MKYEHRESITVSEKNNQNFRVFRNVFKMAARIKTRPEHTTILLTFQIEENHLAFNCCNKKMEAETSL